MLRRLAIAFLLIPAAGCDSPTEPPAGVTVTMELSQEIAAPGDVVEAEITLRNDSNTTLTVASGGCGSGLLEVRRLLDQRVVAQGDPSICLTMASVLEVEPGSEASMVAFLTISSSTKPIPPGNYITRGIVQILEYGTARSAPQLLQVID